MTREEFIKIVTGTSWCNQVSCIIALSQFLDHDEEQRKVIEQQAKKIQELEDWKKIVAGTDTDQEAVIRMAATEYTKVAVQCWKEKCEQQEQEIERLQKQIEWLTESDEIAKWYEGLVKRAKIGTKGTSSLKAYIEQCEQEISRLREALQAIVSQCEDEDWEYMFSDILKQAQQALKGVK